MQKIKYTVFCCLAAWVTMSENVSAATLAGKPKAEQKTAIRISFGHRAARSITHAVQILPGSEGLKVAGLAGSAIEKNDKVAATSILHAGKGDVDMLKVDVAWPEPTAEKIKLASHKDQYTVKNDAMWGYLMENGSKGQAERLLDDTWQQPDKPVLTIQLAEDGTKGFSIAVEQLLRHGAMWLPEHDCYITLADKPVDFNKHLASFADKRTLDVVKNSPDASLAEFRQKWEDLGNPLAWDVPWQTKYLGTTGHLVVTAAAHGSLYKFAIDRWGNVRPDFASPHRFKFDIAWPESQWKEQMIINGLPILVTKLQKDGQLCEIEQFAAPLGDLPRDGRGDIPSVLLSKIRLSGQAGPAAFSMKVGGVSKGVRLEMKQSGEKWSVVEQGSNAIWLSVDTGPGFSVQATEIRNQKDSTSILELKFNGKLNAGETREILAKLASPALPAGNGGVLEKIDFAGTRASVVNYWESWISKGASFEVPEQAVNDLFRANLWHALILPRHKKLENGVLQMDLPYANTAYGQKNADWPVNQAVYVDYMLYALRGYQPVADAEIMAMFHSQQQQDGRIAGFANWAVYSPAHLYTIGKNYLLSRDQKGFDRMLPQALKTLDWCLVQIRNARNGSSATGLVRGPLNDLTHADREWAFSQAYYVAGLDLFGRALAEQGHARSAEVLAAAATLKKDVDRAFSRSAVKATVVQLADGSWVNFVPTDAMTPRRMMEQWYPTDVDCGPLHLSRLNVLDPRGWLTTAMLHDHEDNLFLKNLGAANEPVYVQQAAAYLSRDEPKAAIRAFYSLMACGFSHHQLSPIEHRWAWGQYYGPPSTDGAWFELYRNMLLTENDSSGLLLGQAIPRDWLENGKKIRVKNAPTNFGPLSYTMESQATTGSITAAIELSDRNPPADLRIRFRHPQSKPIRSVLINGKPWKDFDVKNEWVRIVKPVAGMHRVTVKY